MTNRDAEEMRLRAFVHWHKVNAYIQNEDSKLMAKDIKHILKALDAKSARIKKLEDALRFYADTENWSLSEITRDESGDMFYKIRAEIVKDESETEYRISTGGKRAREALGE